MKKITLYYYIIYLCLVYLQFLKYLILIILLLNKWLADKSLVYKRVILLFCHS